MTFALIVQTIAILVFAALILGLVWREWTEL